MDKKKKEVVVLTSTIKPCIDPLVQKLKDMNLELKDMNLTLLDLQNQIKQQPFEMEKFLAKTSYTMRTDQQLFEKEQPKTQQEFHIEFQKNQEEQEQIQRQFHIEFQKNQEKQEQAQRQFQQEQYRKEMSADFLNLRITQCEHQFSTDVDQLLRCIKQTK